MKVKNDKVIAADFVIKEGATVSGEIQETATEPNKDLVEVSIKKKYTFRGVTIETGSIQVGEGRALQLARGGFLNSEVVDTGITERVKERAKRTQKTDPPTIVEHKITE